MASTTKILLITIGLCLATACQSSIERVKGALSTAPEWYTSKRNEIAGEGYPDLICRANEFETILVLQPNPIFEKTLLDIQYELLKKFASLIEEDRSDDSLVRAKKVLSALQEDIESTSIWTQDELDEITKLLDSLPAPSEL